MAGYLLNQPWVLESRMDSDKYSLNALGLFTGLYVATFLLYIVYISVHCSVQQILCEHIS